MQNGLITRAALSITIQQKLRLQMEARRGSEL